MKIWLIKTKTKTNSRSQNQPPKRNQFPLKNFVQSKLNTLIPSGALPTCQQTFYLSCWMSHILLNRCCRKGIHLNVIKKHIFGPLMSDKAMPSILISLKDLQSRFGLVFLCGYDIWHSSHSSLHFDFDYDCFEGKTLRRRRRRSGSRTT